MIMRIKPQQITLTPHAVLNASLVILINKLLFNIRVHYVY